ncbi:importin subunit alpha-2-like [Dorcoceras hygrometricum]|uniref:Importin subunit alpha-2-like n=1 Tax=Dorcoceras hygrometricum TaxID=472368 RepID=A0A2Z7DBB9_9LAMI|nr:importin subunit alpha-2-like [Dorcoceras hygrometricum]
MSKLLTKAQLVPSILKFYLNRSYSGTTASIDQTASSLVTAHTTGGIVRELNSEAQTHRRTLYSTVAKTHQLTASSRSLSNVEPGFLTGINRKSYSRRAQHHQSLSKQRRKSLAIYRRSVRMNSNCRGFTGENDEESRVQNTLSVE